MRSRRPPHLPSVLMINSGKTDALRHLRAVTPDADLDVITEAAYARHYPPGVRLRLVADIGDLTAVRLAAMDVATARGGIDYVVAPSERSQQAGGYLRSFLGLPGIGFDVANRFSNKAVMKAAFAAHGIAVAPYRVVTGLDAVPKAAAEVGWPVVVKPALGTGSLNTFAVTSPAAWSVLAASPAAGGLSGAGCPLLVEQFVTMEGEYHCDGMVADGEVTFAAASRYFMPLLGNIDAFTGSYLLPDGHQDAAAMLGLHQRAVRALGLRTGITHLEAFKTDGGFVAGEIACRPAGGGIAEAIELQYGIDLWRVFIQTSLGQVPDQAGPARRLRDDIIVNCDLPVRPGKVRAISSAADLAAVRDVVRVTMSTGPGDVIGTRLHSASTTGLVYLAVAEEAQVNERLAELARAYVLEVDPVISEE